jgi:hypothetical protein
MWSKRGLIFHTDRNFEWMVTHAAVPTALPISDDLIRIYFAPRNIKGQSIPTFVDVSSKDPKQVIRINDNPILGLGKMGTFDDSGIMPCSIIRDDNKLYLYYVGWNQGVSVPYRNAIGVAISEDNGITFSRVFDGAIVDRNAEEPYFTATPWVLKEGELWHMWYASSTGFRLVDDKVEALYVIKYASSEDGLIWRRSNVTCIHPLGVDEANARPTVIKEGNRYKMWFCYRSIYDFRDGTGSYKIGYAESENAVNWERMDHMAGIHLSQEGWDSKMQAYPNVIVHNGQKMLFYNGNGFGLSGFGYAVSDI